MSAHFISRRKFWDLTFQFKLGTSLNNFLWCDVTLGRNFFPIFRLVFLSFTLGTVFQHRFQLVIEFGLAYGTDAIQNQSNVIGRTCDAQLHLAWFRFCFRPRV